MVVRREQLVKNGYTGGNNNKRKYLTIHQTDNFSKGANAAAHANLQSNGYRNASWHWTVDDKEAVQSYPHSAVCWHAGDGGNGTGNRESIAIESCVNSDGNYAKTFKNTAELAAYILKSEGIPISNMVQHNRWSGKNCPSVIRKDGQWSAFVDMVKTLMGGSSSSNSSTSRALAVDGVAGTATVKRLQSLLGTPVDGVISSQSYVNKKFFPGFTAVNFGSDGSLAVLALQKKLGVAVDGFLGPNTVKAWQKKLGVSVDGYFGSASVKALQRALNKGSIW